MIRPRPAFAHAPQDFRSFRRQESILVLFGLAVVAVLLLVHVAFLSVLGTPTRPLLVTLLALFFLLAIELLWLNTTRADPGPRTVRTLAAASVWMTLGVVAVVTFVGEVEDRHYSVLMVLPVVAAAFRFSLPGTLGVAGVAGVLNFVEVHWYYHRHPPPKTGEYFEAFGVSLILVLVGIVVWLLASQVRRDQARLERSLRELERTRDRLVEEEKLAAVGRLAGAIAHEIRNPVAMISSSLATAMRRTVSPEDRDQMYRIAATEAGRLETLTSDFLAYARPRTVAPNAVAVSDALGYVAGLVRARAAESDVTIVVRAPPDRSVAIDVAQMQQALLNLAVNAIEASPPGGVVALGSSTGADGVEELWIENPGERIDDATARRIFEPFFTTKPRGTGLGLAIARNVARAHGGDVRLAVNEPGRVRFAIALPAPPALVRAREE